MRFIFKKSNAFHQSLIVNKENRKISDLLWIEIGRLFQNPLNTDYTCITFIGVNYIH